MGEGCQRGDSGWKAHNDVCLIYLLGSDKWIVSTRLDGAWKTKCQLHPCWRETKKSIVGVDSNAGGLRSPVADCRHRRCAVSRTACRYRQQVSTVTYLNGTAQAKKKR